jgi:hypothetical protein
MPRRRYVSTDISIDKRLNLLARDHGDFAALLYTWMIPHAGDDATMNGDIEEFMATVIPMRRDKTEADIQAALTAMTDMGLLVWDGRAIFFPVEAFYRYQSYIPADKRRPNDVSAEQRETPTNAASKDVMDTPDSTPQNADERRRTPQNAVIPSPSPSPSPSLSSAPPKTGGRSRKEPFVPLSEEERQKLLTDFPGSEEQIELALAHEAHWKYPTGQYLYVRNWLKRPAIGGQPRPEPSRGIEFVNDMPKPRGITVPDMGFRDD